MAANPEKPLIGVNVEEAWTRFKDRLRAFVLRRVGSTADAEDVVQDVLVRLLEHRERIESDRLAGWIFTTARNTIIDRRRRARRDPSAGESGRSRAGGSALDAERADGTNHAGDAAAAGCGTCGPGRVDDVAAESGVDGQELAGCVQPLLAMLSAEDREVLEQVEIAGRSQTDMAALSAAPASTIKSRVQRARRRLREHFERCCAIEVDARGNPRDYSSRGSPEYPRCSGCGDCGCE